jgi:hypothetical protein
VEVRISGMKANRTGNAEDRKEGSLNNRKMIDRRVERSAEDGKRGGWRARGEEKGRRRISSAGTDGC